MGATFVSAPARRSTGAAPTFGMNFSNTTQAATLCFRVQTEPTPTYPQVRNSGAWPGVPGIAKMRVGGAWVWARSKRRRTSAPGSADWV